MPSVSIMEYNKQGNRFQFLQQVKLASIPTKGDLVTLNIEDTGYIFRVFEVHYADNERTDVNVIRISHLTDYVTKIRLVE